MDSGYCLVEEPLGVGRSDVSHHGDPSGRLAKERHPFRVSPVVTDVVPHPPERQLLVKEAHVWRSGGVTCGSGVGEGAGVEGKQRTR